jgi:hypothetical protein
MSNNYAPFDPDLTTDGIQRLITQLDGDLLTVKGSSASQTIKDTLDKLTSELTAALQQALNPGIDVNTWVTSLQPKFKDYIDTLALTFPYVNSMKPPPTTGACSYRNGCIQTTQPQCTVLGGIFYPGQPCP